MLHMTTEWAIIANSIAIYVELKKKNGSAHPRSYIDEYNDWVHWSGYQIQDADLAEWCTDFIKTQYNTSSSLIRKALEFDGIPIESMKPV